ncbi:MAG: flagellar biosynthetic protein FliR [Pseudomonadota bacterium]
METALAAIFQSTAEGVWIAMGIFMRIGAAVFLVPGLGERAVSIRVRLMAALGIAVVLSPMVAPLAPQRPATATDLSLVLAAEAVIGLIIGFAFRLLVFALQTAGFVAAQSISVAQMFGAGVAPEPEPTIATLLAYGGIVMMMMAGLHVHLVVALVELYDIFPFGRFPAGADVAQWGIEQSARTFALGVTLAAPFVAIGFAYNIALGALNRAMPQLLVALVGVPFLVWIGMVVLYHVMPSLYDSWQQPMREILANPIGGLG